jgi:hypothetical protein
MDPVQYAIDIIDQTMGIATDYSSQAASWASQIANMHSSTAPVRAANLEYEPVANPPEAPIVETESNPAFRREFDYAFNRFDDEFRERVAWLVETYFPTLDGELVTSSDDWIIDQIQNGGTGLPTNVEEALYSRGKDRIYQAAAVTDQQAVASFAARGFSLPQGVLTAKLADSQFSTKQALGNLARDVLVKNTEIQVETTKFAVQMAVQLRLGLINALSAFLNAAADVPKGATQYAQLFTESKRNIAGAIVDYYNAQIREQELKLRADTEERQLEFSDLNSYRPGFANDISGYGSRVAAAAAAVGGMGQAALMSVNAFAGANVEGSAT